MAQSYTKPDGTRVEIDDDGATYTRYTNGDLFIDEPDGSSSQLSKDANGNTTVTMWDSNGDITRTSVTDAAGNTTVVSADGHSTYTSKDGDVYISNADGTWSSYNKADDTLVTKNDDGTTTTTKGDGPSVTVDSNGNPVISPADAGTTTTDANGKTTAQTDNGIIGIGEAGIGGGVTATETCVPRRGCGRTDTLS